MRNGGRILVFCFKNKSKNKSLRKAQPLKREEKKNSFIRENLFSHNDFSSFQALYWQNNFETHNVIYLFLFKTGRFAHLPRPSHKENLSTVSISKWRILPIKCPENLVLFLFYLFFVLFLVIKPETRFRGQIQKKN